MVIRLEDAFRNGWEMANVAGAEDDWQDAFSLWQSGEDVRIAAEPHLKVQEAAQAHYEKHILSALVMGEYPLTTEPGYENSFETVLRILRSDEGLHRRLGYLARAFVYQHAIDAIEESQARMADLEKVRPKAAMIAGHTDPRTVANGLGKEPK